jgi:hypothetical protein
MHRYAYGKKGWGDISLSFERLEVQASSSVHHITIKRKEKKVVDSYHATCLSAYSISFARR